ncbi:restriction endonuclease [Micromonospora chersina]|uniref:restriction endonuclease n=1 Tax=Micromonospora chersina TaxID=47854 RepID=UPI0037223BC5
MIALQVLSGYILEELLARLIQSAGYRLLVHERQDRFELKNKSNGDLQVKGRGGVHQVDVLGEFTVVPAFSQPIRLFIEAKARKSVTGISAVRNAVGTVNDVNEAWMVDYSTNRVRRHYRYGLFSTSGFSKPAQDYAIAHQISLIDLSGPEWVGLVDGVNSSSEELLRRLPADADHFPVRRLRQHLRRALGTMPDRVPNLPDDVERVDYDFHEGAEIVRRRFEAALDGALLAFPAGHQVLLARPDDLEAFLRYANEDPEHRVSLAVDARRARDGGRTWVVRPFPRDRDAYALRLTLPAAVEAIALAESERRAQSLAAKGQLGGRLDIFWDPHGEEATRLLGPRLFRLVFAESELRHRRPDQGEF